jgi:hypothetical protein
MEHIGAGEDPVIGLERPEQRSLCAGTKDLIICKRHAEEEMH